MTIDSMRQEYEQGELREADAGDDPFALFTRWFEQARASTDGPWFEANSMTLATVDADGLPDARIVLLKDFTPEGLTFFTHYTSAKGQQLDAHPHAAVVFHWSTLERQVRIAGPVEKVSRAESEAYWARRPRGSQLGSAVSEQSGTATGRDELEVAMAKLTEKCEGGPVPCPPTWGGYRLVPDRFEFWQGRASRLHDRLRYVRLGDGSWQRDRLWP